MSTTIIQALKAAQAELISADIPTSRLDAEVLLSHVLGTTREALFLDADRALTSAESGAFLDLVAARVNRIPVARLLGEKEFWSLDFALNAHTLVPRPDSETLVETALEEAGSTSGQGLRILDLGTGSGCLLIALLSELPDATGVGIDCVNEAIACAGENGKRHHVGDRVSWLQNDWLTGLTPAGISGPFDLIISNPPYIERGDIAGLAPEVAQHDPSKALDGGDDGLDAYRLLAEQIPGFLSDVGRVVLEIGVGQASDVSDIFDRSGLETSRYRKDIAGLRRVVVLRRAQK